MTHLVADIGNTRIKWGRCAAGQVAEIAAVDPDEPDAWRRQLAAWKLDQPQRWTLAGVHPPRRDRFRDWLLRHGHQVAVLDHFAKLPLRLQVGAPESVGIDRLLNVLAAKGLVAPGTPALVVDAGSAVTVDLLDDSGAFAGGAIFPGLRLMAEALHTYTALLPLVDVRNHPAVVPAGTTVTAIAGGIHWATVGGIHALLRATSLVAPSAVAIPVFLTGGDAPSLFPDLPRDPLFRYEQRPTMTLEGIRIAAEAGT